MALVLSQTQNSLASLCQPIDVTGLYEKPRVQRSKIVLADFDPSDLLQLRQKPCSNKPFDKPYNKPKIINRVVIPDPGFTAREETLLEFSGPVPSIQPTPGRDRLEKLFERKSKYYQNMRLVEQVFPTAHIRFHATMRCRDKILYNIDVTKPPFDANPQAIGQDYSFSIFEIRDVDGNVIRHPQIVPWNSGEWLGEWMNAMKEAIPYYVGGDLDRHECYLNTPSSVNISCIDNTIFGTGQYDFTSRQESKKYMSYFQFQEFNLKAGGLLEQVISQLHFPGEIKTPLLNGDLAQLLISLEEYAHILAKQSARQKRAEQQAFNAKYNEIMNEGSFRSCISKKKRLYQYQSIIKLPNGDLIAEIKKLVKKFKDTGAEVVKKITIKYLDGVEEVISADIDEQGRLSTKTRVKHRSKQDFKYGYKVASTILGEKCLIKLQIPKGARVATSGCQETKVRTNLCTPVKIVKYEYIDNKVKVYWDKPLTEAYSCVQVEGFKYQLGQEIYIRDFDHRTDWVCVEGIHFHFTVEETLYWHRLTGIKDIDMVDLQRITNFIPENDIEIIEV